MIMEALLEYVDAHAPDTAYVTLMADHGTPEFYRRFGFEPVILPTNCGMFMRINRAKQGEDSQTPSHASKSAHQDPSRRQRPAATTSMLFLHKPLVQPLHDSSN